MLYFSLILPCYNVGSYVGRCVRSILGQDFEDYEIILVDDGSTDDTPSVCDTLAAEHRRIRVIHKENGGLASARNTGMDAAQGRYIWFVDPDDWIENGALSLLHQVCERDAADVVKFDHYRVEKDRKLVRSSAQPGVYAGAQLEQLQRLAFCEAGKFVLSACMHVYRRSLLMDNHMRFISEKMVGSEDYLFMLQLFVHWNKLSVIDAPLYDYELREGSLTQTYKPDLAMRYVELRKQVKTYYEAHGKLHAYNAGVERFFLWHLLIGICVLAEYNTAYTGHSISEGRQMVYRLLRMKEVRPACQKADRYKLGWKKRIVLMAIWLRIEPVFYFLFGNRE